MAHLALAVRYHVTDNIWSFDFKPDTYFKHLAGQFIKVELPHPSPDQEGMKRFFTISSTPQYPLVRITTRITTSTFKQALIGLQPGQSITMLDPPAGDFIWPDPNTEKPIVFIAQGIGITPFYAMIKDRYERLEELNAVLVYYSYSMKQLPFIDELVSIATSSKLTVITPKPPMTPAIIAGLVPNLNHYMVYVSGPTSLLGLTLPPYNLPVRQLKIDFFPGYPASSY
jgi:ferredoxin-NADP reductase